MIRLKWCSGSSLSRPFLSRSFLVGSLALALALGACGGDDDDGSGVDGDKTLDELSEAEVEELCDWSFDLVSGDDAIRFACYLVALSTSDDAEACEAFAQNCLEDAPPIDRDSIDCTADVEAELPACAAEVTVAELEACSEATADLLANLADEISCDSSPDDVLDFEAPAACIDLEERCPALFEDDDPEDPEDPEAVLRKLSLARAALLR